MCSSDLLLLEASALTELSRRLSDGGFAQAVSLILGARGRVVVTGMGKSGIIGRKIAATLASTGTRSFFMHPGEAYHGDLGMVDRADVVIAISYSGETEEVVRLLPFLVDRDIPMISICGNPASTLAQHAAVRLDASVAREACPLQLAPTASTTAALALGDALAMALMRERAFTPEDFAAYHPGGSLGRRLLNRVRDAMRTDDLPTLGVDAPLTDVLHAVSSGRMGAGLVVDGGGRLKGIVTDGDLRRLLERQGKEAFDLTAAEVMTSNPLSVSPDERLETALQLMNDRNVTVLVVCDDDAGVLGMLNLFDCGL